jgi:toxin ParE1/3/4
MELGLRFLEAAHETFALFATQPDMGWKSKLRHPSLRSMRVFSVGGFEKILIFYRPGPGTVEVVRVLHGSQDLEALFQREGIP